MAGPEALTTRKSQLILLYANLEKLQFHEIDGVLVGDLTSGQEAARAGERHDLDEDAGAGERAEQRQQLVHVQ